MDIILKRFRILYLIIFITSISLSFSGCAWIPFFGDEEDEVELESDFSEFEAFEEIGGESYIEIEELKAELKTLQSQQDEAQSKIEEIEGIVNSLLSSVDQTDQIEDLKDTIHNLESEIVELKDSVAGIEFEAKLRTSTKGVSRGNPRKNYKKALQLYYIKQYKESLRLLKSLDNRRTPLDLRDNVIFWMGQCYFKLEDFQKAVEKFDTVIDDYKGGNKVTDAMYRIGLSYDFLGEKSKALDYLEQALNRGPTIEMRKKIERTMNEIRG